MSCEALGQSRLTLFERLIFYLRFFRARGFLFDADTIIDIGCGYNALFLKWACRHFNYQKVIGIDVAVNKNSNFILREGNLNDSLSIGDSSADIVVSMAVLEHLENPQRNLDEIYRILKSGGRLIMTTPSPGAKKILEFLAFKLGLINRDSIADHKNYFDGKMLKEMLETSGFSSDKIRASAFLFGLNNLVVCNK